MNTITQSKRILYTPGEFAKKSFIYLQEVGQTKALQLHTSKREHLDSYLFFIVLEGNGTLQYKNQTYPLEKNQCVFIDCNSGYSHTSDNWTIQWIHFNGLNSKQIYQKYISRNGNNIITPNNINEYHNLINHILSLSNSDNYIKDMGIYNDLTNILYLLMTQTIYDTQNTHYNIHDIKDYIDSNYLKTITLNELSKQFYINKFYLTRLFKQTYGLTINTYINNKKIAKAKELLRFSNLTLEQIAIECNINDTNYFIRLFKQYEGITPLKYRKQW